jgi:hypothetical protein
MSTPAAAESAVAAGQAKFANGTMKSEPWLSQPHRFRLEFLAPQWRSYLAFTDGLKK